MEFETHCMSFPCTELLLFNYAEVNSIFESRAPLINIRDKHQQEKLTQDNEHKMIVSSPQN